jgi:hypothetical protein
VKLVLMMMSMGLLLLPAPQQDVHLGVPPVGTQSSSGLTYLRPNPNFRGSIRLDCTGKSVSIGWEYSAGGDFTDVELLDGYERQMVTVGYWPTYAEVVDSTTVLVAGKDRSGDTRIERWTVTLPIVTQLVGGGGYSVEVQPLADIEVLYDAAVVGKDMIRTMFRVRGKPSSALVQFYDSGDLYEINWGVAPYSLTTVLAASAEPALTQVYNAFDAGDHSSLGYVYILADNANFFSVPALILVDSNRDGTMDGHYTMTWQAYHAAGLDNAANYVELNGLVQ